MVPYADVDPRNGVIRHSLVGERKGMCNSNEGAGYTVRGPDFSLGRMPDLEPQTWVQDLALPQFLILETKIKISSLQIQFTGLLEEGDETMPGERSYKCLLLSDMSTRALKEVTQLVRARIMTRSLSPGTISPVFFSTSWQGYLVALFKMADQDVVHSTHTQENEEECCTSDERNFFQQLRKINGQ